MAQMFLGSFIQSVIQPVRHDAADSFPSVRSSGGGHLETDFLFQPSAEALPQGDPQHPLACGASASHLPFPILESFDVMYGRIISVKHCPIIMDLPRAAKECLESTFPFSLRRCNTPPFVGLRTMCSPSTSLLFISAYSMAFRCSRNFTTFIL